MRSSCKSLTWRPPPKREASAQTQRGLMHHLLNRLLRETTRSGDRDPLLLAGPQVLCPNVDDAVGVYVEGDLDLGHAPRCGRDPHQLEVAYELVVRRYLALALVDLDLD